MKNRSLKILLHDLSFNNKKTLVLKDYLSIYFEHVFVARGLEKSETNLMNYQYNIIIVLPEVLMVHGAKLYSRIRAMNSLAPILVVSEKDDGARLFDNRVFFYTNKGSMESLLQDIKREIYMICEKEYLCWPRVKSMPGPKHTANEQVIGYSSWIEDVREKIDKFHGEKGPVVIHGPTGTEKYSVVKEIQDQEEKLVNDPLVIVFDEVGAIFSTLQSGERPFIDNKAIPGQINLLEMLASRPVVLRDIEKADHYIQYILSCILKDKPWEQPDNNLYRLYILVDDRNQLQTDLKNILQFFELSVQLPALNQRQEDIPYLINYYLEKYNQQYKKQKEISETAINKLIDYNWPGNIQELEKRIEWLVRNVNGEKIMPGNIDLGHTGQMGR